MITKEEILEKHLKTMIERTDESFSDISEMKKTPEWEATLNAMQEYADANQRELLIAYGLWVHQVTGEEDIYLATRLVDIYLSKK